MDMSKLTDITKDVSFGEIDGESLPLTRCACGATFPLWDFVIGIYPDMPTQCPTCGRLLCFAATVTVYEVEPDNL
jgi:hypothetical protein